MENKIHFGKKLTIYIVYIMLYIEEILKDGP